MDAVFGLERKYFEITSKPIIIMSREKSLRLVFKDPKNYPHRDVGPADFYLGSAANMKAPRYFFHGITNIHPAIRSKEFIAWKVKNGFQ